MNRRFLSVVVFALIASGLVSLLIYRAVVARISSAGKSSGKQVIVAARNIELGTLLRDQDVKLVDWSGQPPAQTVSRKEDVVGRGVIAQIYEGEPVLDGRLAPKGGGAGLSAIIPKGMRAVAVRVNEVIGVAGFVVPGMRVDVLIYGVPPGVNCTDVGSQTKTILQNIEVLSAGQNIQKDAEGKPVNVQVINLLVTPEQAESLSLASNDAKIQLVLRNPLDKEEAKTPGVQLAALFGQPAHAAPQAKAPPRPRPVVHAEKKAVAPPPPPPVVVKIVEMFHSGKKTEAKFEKKTEVKP